MWIDSRSLARPVLALADPVIISGAAAAPFAASSPEYFNAVSGAGRRHGLGTVTRQQAVVGAAGGAAAGVSTAIATGSPIAGGIVGGLMTVAPFTGPAAPFLMAAAGLVAPLASLFRGCGSSCTEATKYANEFSSTLERLNRLYWDQPIRYRSAQLQTLSYMDQAAAWLYELCSNPALGDAGKRCISERLIEGGTAPWCPNPGKVGCDWITTYRKPIANDTGVVDDSASFDDGTMGSQILSAVGGLNLGELVLPLAVVGLGIFMLAGEK